MMPLYEYLFTVIFKATYNLVEIRFMETFYIDNRLMVKVICFSHWNCEENWWGAGTEQTSIQNALGAGG